MSRADTLELAGIAFVVAAAGVIVYGIAEIAPWLAVIVAGLFLLTVGLLMIGLANRGAS